MKSRGFWPLHGDEDEVVFTYSNSRRRSHIERVLTEQFTGTLISDGYAAYARYAAAQEGVHPCPVLGAHARRLRSLIDPRHPDRQPESSEAPRHAH